MGLTRSPLWRMLEHPLTRHVDLDHPDTSILRRRIIKEKPFLRRIYCEWYGDIAAALPPGREPVLELGSGPGFLRESVPGVLTSDIQCLPGLLLALDAMSLPFAPCALRAIVMTNVLHHLPDVTRFFREAARCVKPDGVVVMIEPWVTPWSTLIYKRLHAEPFHPDAVEWGFSSRGPLSDANGALPWIVFERDRARFERECPGWRVHQIRPGMPFRYLLSGGLSMRALMPSWTFGLWKRLEERVGDRLGRLAMFAQIVLVRQHAASGHQ